MLHFPVRQDIKKSKNRLIFFDLIFFGKSEEANLPNTYGDLDSYKKNRFLIKKLSVGNHGVGGAVSS